MLSSSIIALARAASLGSSIALAQASLSTDSLRSSPGVFDSGDSVYNYAPTILLDGRYRMWWCGQPPNQTVAGDHILYAESSSLDGPFTSRDGSAAFDVVFAPTGNGTFDNKHTCDPSVVRANGTYYLFYGAEQDDNLPTTIGVASSPDGINWARLNSDRAIVTQSGQQKTKSAYGAGQPSTIYLDGMFYMTFTDTTGAGSDGNGGGQYVWRSADATFQSNVEVLTSTGWQTMTTANSRSRSIVDANSVDWQYSDALDAFIIAHDSAAEETTLTFLDPKDFSVKYADVNIAGNWTEGPGIVSRLDKHSVVSTTNDCGRVPIDIMRSSTGNPPTGLAHIGVDVLSGIGCPSMAASQVAKVYDGYILQASGLPAAVVVEGVRLQIEQTAVVTDLSKNSISVPESIYNVIQYGASLKTGQAVIGIPTQPASFELDNNVLWPVNCGKIISDNNSNITMVDSATWQSHHIGPSLYCLN